VLSFGVVLIALVLAGNAYWLQQNELPDGFQNEYEHLYTLTEVFFRVRDHSLAEAQHNLWDGYYPPLLPVVGAAGMSVFGRSIGVAVGSLEIFLVLLLAGVGLIAHRVAGARTAALALSFAALYPGIYGNARRFEPNIALAAMVAVAVAWLVLRPRLPQVRDALVLGLIFGLGMLADRVVFAIYLLLPVTFLLVSAVREPGALKTAVVRWATVLGVGLLLCGYYYVRFFKGHVGEVTTQLGGEITAFGDQSAGHSAWTILGLAYYPLSWVDGQMGGVLGVLSLLGLILYLVRGREELEPVHRGLLESWLFGGLFIITLVSKKQAFYSIPLLAPAAVLAAVGWRSVLPGRKSSAGVLVLVLTLGSYQLAFRTFGPDLVPAPGRWAMVAGNSPLPPQFLGSEYTMAAAPDPQGLRLDDAAAMCRAHQVELAVEGNALPYLVLFSDSQRAYEGQVMPTLRLAMDSLQVEGVLMNGEAVEDQGGRAGCFLYVTDGSQDWPSFSDVQEEWAQWGVGDPAEGLRLRLAEMRQRVVLHRSWTTRWGSAVHLFTLVKPGSPDPS